MKVFELGATGRRTTQIGFGCAYLRPESATLLDVAFDAGIRHFDVARSYGRGQTEHIVGKFLAKHGKEVTVTTKYGFVPPVMHPLHVMARKFVRPAFQWLRRLPSVQQQIAQMAIKENKRAIFSADEARLSLETSLRNLKRDRIDILLMHEAAPEDLQDHGLLAFLEQCLVTGVIGAFGVGGEAIRVPKLYELQRQFCSILQYNWSPLDPVINYPGSFSIVYRIFNGQAAAIGKMLNSNPTLTKRWSDQVDIDLSQPNMIGRLLFKAAIELRTIDLILFSSTKPENIICNVKAAEDNSLTQSALRLIMLLKNGPSITIG